MALTKISRGLLDTGVSDSSDATAITIDSNENVGIGTTSPTYKLDVKHDNVGEATVAQFGGDNVNNIHDVRIYNSSQASGSLDEGVRLIFQLGNTNTGWIQAFKEADGTSAGNRTGGLAFYTSNANSVTEKMRITSSGEVLIGSTGSGAAGGLYVNSSASNSSVGAVRLQTSDYQGSSDLSTTAISVVKSSSDTTTSQTFIRFGINSFSAGSGQINANGANQCAFGTFSDRTLKENITDLPTQLDKIKTLRPVEFDYIESQGGGHQLGFIAQEVEEIYPDMVGETEGKKTLAGLGKWEARLIKAIQELSVKVEELESKINE